MKRLRGLGVLAVFLSIAATSCGPSEYSARFEFPGSSSVIRVDLTHMHPYLAEYKRHVILQVPDRTEFSRELFPDTGGYSRVNLYRLSANRYYLATFGNEDYSLDIADGRFEVVRTREHVAPSSAEFVGAFDWRRKSGWSFVPQSERAEIPIGEMSIED